MSARQLRRAQCDAYGLCARDDERASSDESEDEGEDEGVVVLKVENPFAALLGSDEDEDAEDAGEEHGEENE